MEIWKDIKGYEGLYQTGVGNWEYYDGAMNIYNGWKEEEE